MTFSLLIGFERIVNEVMAGSALVMVSATLRAPVLPATGRRPVFQWLYG